MCQTVPLCKQLRLHYDAGAILTKAGITPSRDQRYTLPAVREAFIAEVGVEPWVQCSGGHLSQIGLCINKATLKPFQCAKAMYIKVPACSMAQIYNGHFPFVQRCVAMTLGGHVGAFLGIKRGPYG